jgi:predicted patatin/cPLA2 family phospholipase
VTAALIDLLRARAGRGGRRPFDDEASIALVVEGGAMRGVVSAGMVSALEALGLTHAFDAVYGSSAGAINAAYFLAGQASLGTTIYYEDINNRRFISMTRAFSRRPILDLTFLLDDVMVRRKRLDAGRVLCGPTPFTILATSVETGSAAALRTFPNAPALAAALRASATMPIVAGDPWLVDGARYFDASLTEPVAVPTAEADGHTHVLALLTRPSESPRTVTVFDRAVVLPRLRRISPALAALYLDRGRPYTRLLETIAAGTGPLGRTKVTGLRPRPPMVGKLERHRGRLEAGAQRGFEAVMTAFGVRPADAGGVVRTGPAEVREAQVRPL